MENSRETLDQSGLTGVPTKRESCLRLEGVSKNFEGLLAVEDVSLEISSGERRAVIGPNGAGKTTLFNLIAGNLSPTRGKVFLLGENITKLPCHRRAHKGIARTYQITNLFFNLPVIDNLVLAARPSREPNSLSFAPLLPIATFTRKGLNC